MIEITSPVGRLVSGHPMISHAVVDEKTKQPKMQQDGATPRVDFYVGLAIPKGPEQHWNQTAWGQQIHAEALASFPNGEHAMAAFAWKIVDGDSQIPNKNMKKPCDMEGYPGHWIINASNGFAIKCYHRGQYEPSQQIQQKEAIKRGDYCRLVFTVRGNGAAPPNTPGVYINPSMFELYQAGVEIVSENAADPNATFGAVEGQLPANAQVDPNMAAPANAPNTPGVYINPSMFELYQAGVEIVSENAADPNMAAPANAPATPAPGGGPSTPATDILKPPVEVKYMTPDGKGPWTEAQLSQAGYTPEMIAGLAKAP